MSKLAGESLGGPGSPDPQSCARAAIDALSGIAGPEMRLAQFQLDLSSHAIDQGEVAVTARADKRTRSIVFASAEARSGSEIVFRAQALFSRKES